MATPLDTEINDSLQMKPKGWVKSQTRAFARTVKDFAKDPLKAAKKTLTSLMRKAWQNQRELRILVTGKTGQGKSTLINGILGCKVAQEGARATRCTTEVTVYSKTIEGVPIKVFDSPGLQDRTDNEEEYIRGMREKCQELSLILYCTKMTNPRLTDDDKNAMIKLTKAFGEKFWEFTVFVLTFANQEDVEIQDDRDEDEIEPEYDDDRGWKELKKRRFEGRLKVWKEDLHRFLINEVGVSPDIVVNIPLVPTGHSKITRSNRNPFCLPDRENWFTSYWETCCLRVKETRLFLKINEGRIVSDDKPDDEEDSEDEDVEDETDSDDVKTMDLRPLININFADRRSVFEPQTELMLPVEEMQKPKPALQAKQNDISKFSRITKSSPPLSSPPKLPLTRNMSGETVILRQNKREFPQSRQATSVVLSSKNVPEEYYSLSRPRSQSLASSCPPTPTAHKDLTKQTIYIHPTLVRDITAQTMRRAGIQESLIKAGAGKAIDNMKKPGKWLMSTYQRNKKVNTINDIG